MKHLKRFNENKENFKEVERPGGYEELLNGEI
jgi:hypothetical protein